MVGFRDGFFVGNVVGRTDAILVGACVGDIVGKYDGIVLGENVGDRDGKTVGKILGNVGVKEGVLDGQDG